MHQGRAGAVTRSRGATGVRDVPRPLAVAVALVLVAVLAGCGIRIPADPDGALDRVSGGVLRVGASPDSALVSIEASGGQAADERIGGAAAELARGFADALDARIDWTVGSEETLVGEMERGELDLIVGGMTGATPWADRVAVTREYPGIPGADGRAIVMFVPLGENRFLSALERYLDDETSP